MRTWIRNAILSLALAAGIAPAFAQVPSPVPALPDTERRVSYSISASLCSCAISFQLYGDSTDYANWLEVFVNGVLVPQSGNWTIASPSGSLATLPRPIADAVLTFAAAQTGTVQIVGARRPRRTSQFQESQPVPTRNFNVGFSDITATLRELWDKTNDFTGRSVRTPPGETLALLPALANRQNMGACFDSGGNLNSCVAASGSFVAGNGITFTGTNPTTITNNISAGAGITITGTNPLVIASNSGSGDPASITNCSLAASVSANALTVSLKTAAGVDPTPTVPCSISFRNGVATNGTYTSISATGPVSFSTGVSGSTFGALNATPFRLWITAFNVNGPIVLGVSKQATATAVLPIDETSFPATALCNACTTASTAGLIYTTGGVSGMAVRILGYMEWATGLTTAGVWNTGPTEIQMMSLGVKKPGEVVQSAAANFAPGSGSSTTGLTFVSTNVTQSITPTSSMNSIAWAFSLETTVTTISTLCSVRMSRGGVGIGPQIPGAFGSTATSYVAMPSMFGADLPGSTGPLTYTVQANSSSGVNSCIWNDGNGGGAISLAEIMN